MIKARHFCFLMMIFGSVFWVLDQRAQAANLTLNQEGLYRKSENRKALAYDLGVTYPSTEVQIFSGSLSAEKRYFESGPAIHDLRFGGHYLNRFADGFYAAANFTASTSHQVFPKWTLFFEPHWLILKNMDLGLQYEFKRGTKEDIHTAQGILDVYLPAEHLAEFRFSQMLFPYEVSAYRFIWIWDGLKNYRFVLDLAFGQSYEDVDLIVNFVDFGCRIRRQFNNWGIGFTTGKLRNALMEEWRAGMAVDVTL